MSTQYEKCKCGSKETYISFAGDVCCSSCFKSLKIKVVKVEDNTAIVVKDDGGWSVKVNGITVKYFTKYEDYALTDAYKFAVKLNIKNKQIAKVGTEP